MEFCVTTPLAVVLEANDVSSIRSEDETGSFGVLPGHADFITVLPASVITWRDNLMKDHYVVVRSAVFSVRKGSIVNVAAREAVGEDNLRAASALIAAQSSVETRTEEESRLAATRLHLAAIRQLQRYLVSGRGTLVDEIGTLSSSTADYIT